MNRHVFALAALLGSAALFLPAVLEAQGRRSHQAKCANHLRSIGLAMVMYGDDKRFLPHVGRTRDPEAGVESTHTATKLRALVHYGYHDNPTGFVCPSSDDSSQPIRNAEVRDNMRKWHWEGRTNLNPNTPPWLDTAGDPKGNESHEFSYGLTRRGFNRNISSTKLLGADRAVRDGATTGALAGNHDEGWNLLKADCTVQWTAYSSESAKSLVSTERGGGYLAIKDQSDASKLKPLGTSAPPATPFAGYYKSQSGLLLEIAPSEWSKRAGTWGVRGSVVVEDATWPLVGRTTPAGLAGRISGPRGTDAFSARFKQDTVSIEVDGRTLEFTRTERPLRPLDRKAKNMVAVGLVVALKTQNLPAARAFLSPAASARTSTETLKALSAELVEAEEQDLPGIVATFEALVVLCKDGVARVDLGGKPKQGDLSAANERSAILSLKILANSQTLFREGDKDGNGDLDYADSLADLAKAGLIDKALATGEKQGYAFLLRRSSKEPLFMWMAVASPTKKGAGRSFAINHAGAIFTKDTPFEFDLESAQIKGGKPLGR